MKKKKIPFHVMQAGGVTPINAPLLSQGETAQLLFQGAATPIDSGATTAARFSSIHNQRMQLNWQKYAFEVNREMQERQLDMQEENMDLAREQFEFRKYAWEKEFTQSENVREFQQASWEKEFSQQEKANWYQQTIATTQLAQQLDTGIQSVYGERGIAGAMAYAVTPAQQNAIMESHRQFQEANRLLMEGMSSQDRDMVMEGYNMGRMAPYNSKAMQANSQIGSMSQQMAAYQADPKQYNPYYYDMALHHLMNAPVDAPVDLLVDDTSKLLDKWHEMNKDVYGLPEVDVLDPGVVNIIQRTPDARNSMIDYLKSDPTGSYRKEYEMRRLYDPNVKDTDISYDDWVNERVTAEVNSMYNPNVKISGTNWKAYEDAIEHASEYSPGGMDPRWGGTYDTSVGLGSYDVTPYPRMRIDYDLFTNTAFDPEEGMGGLRKAWDSMFPGGNATRFVEDDPDTNRLLMIGASLMDGISFTDFDRGQYVNADGSLTEDGWRISKGIKKLRKLDMSDEPIVHKFGDKDLQKEVNYDFGLKENGGPIDELASLPDVLFMEPGRGGKMFNRKELMDSFDETGKTHARITGYVDKENALPILASAQKSGGVADPWIYGMSPWVLEVTQEDGESRQFIIPRDQEFRDKFPQQEAMNKLYVQAAMAGGEEIPIAFDARSGKEMIGNLMSGYRGLVDETGRRIFDSEESWQRQVDEWANSIQSVQLTGEPTFTKGPLAQAKEGDFAFNFSKNDADGTIVVQDLARSAEAMDMAQILMDGLGPAHRFESYQGVDQTSGTTFYSLSIDGNEPIILAGSPEQKRDALQTAMLNANQVIKTLKPDGDVMGSWDGLQSMGGVKMDSEGQISPRMQISDIFLESEGGFRDFDTILTNYNKETGKRTKYIVTSLYRPEDEQSREHKLGRAIDLRYTPEMFAFMKTIVPEFEASPRGGNAQFYAIPNTKLMVTLHDNRNDPSGGQHFDIRFNPSAGL